MRGLPPPELLRRCTPLIAVAAALAVVPTAAGGGPQPDRAPSASATLAPDPVPGTAHRSRAPVKPVATRPVRPRPAYVPPAATPTQATAAPRPKVRHPVARRPHRRPAPTPRPAPFLLPRVSLPVLVAADPVHSPGDLDAVLAGLALLLAAATAGSGARLVVVWNRRAEA